MRAEVEQRWQCVRRDGDRGLCSARAQSERKKESETKRAKTESKRAEERKQQQRDARPNKKKKRENDDILLCFALFAVSRSVSSPVFLPLFLFSICPTLFFFINQGTTNT